jgi:hypothetical protein
MIGKHALLSFIATSLLIPARLPGGRAFTRHGEGPSSSHLEPSIPPQCQFLSPVKDAVVVGPTLRVELWVTDDRAIKKQDVTFQIVGTPGRGVTAKPIPAISKGGPRRKLPPHHRFGQVFTAQLPLPGGDIDLTVSAVVLDRDGNKAGATIHLRHKNGARQGVLFLLCVGISHYFNSLYNLPFAAGDAAAIQNRLPALASPLYSKVRPILLTNETATVPRLRGELQKLRGAGPDDTVLVF